MINVVQCTRHKGLAIMTTITYSQKDYLSISNNRSILHVNALNLFLSQNRRHLLFRKNVKIFSEFQQSM